MESSSGRCRKNGGDKMSIHTTIHEALRLDMPFRMESITRLTISQKLNDHAYAEIEGTVGEDALETCLQMNEQNNISIRQTDKNGETILFTGVPVALHVVQEGQTKVWCRMCDYSVFMDYEKKKRSFQREDSSYRSLFSEIIKEHGGDLIDCACESSSYQAPLIQYGETDWEFLKRVSSYIGAVLYPCVMGVVPQLCIGFGDGGDYHRNHGSRQMEKHIREYRRFKDDGKDHLETDFITCQVEDSSGYQIGDRVTCDSISYRITGTEYSLKKGVLEKHCHMQQDSGLCRERQYNSGLKGLSLTGRITDVEADRLKLHLDIDGGNEGGSHWYPWKRADWFCMPEKGSRGVLYIPSKDEGTAFVKSLTRTDGNKNKKVQDPDNQCLITKHHKGMEFTPASMTFYADKGDIFLRLSGKSGVEVSSSEALNLYAGPKLKMNCRNLRIESQEQILLATSKTNIVIDDLIHISG